MALVLNPTTGKFDVVKDKAKEIKVENIPGSTYRSVQDWINITGSDGLISGGTITDNENTTIDLELGALYGLA